MLKRFGLLSLFLMLLAMPAAVAAQLQPTQEPIDRIAKTGSNAIGWTRGSFVVAPIPLSNPTIGSGLILGAGYLFTIDEGSNPSSVGIGGFRTDNGSRGVGGGISLSFGDKRWSLGLVGGSADVVYDFYGTGSLPLPAPIRLRQSVDLVRLNAGYGLTPKLTLGVEVAYGESTVALDNTGAAEDIPDLGIRLGLFKVGPTLSWDTRDNTIYPTDGTHVSFKALYGDVVSGIERDYWKGILLTDFYRRGPWDTVIAGRLAACRAGDTAPFYDLCALGGTDAFRGYPVGQYLDTGLASGQIALRGTFGRRFGYTVFAGVAALGPDFGDLGPARVAGGAGVRYRLSRKFPLDLSVDVAFNQDSEALTYIYVGQRF
jgi:hypothetical protein